MNRGLAVVDNGTGRPDGVFVQATFGSPSSSPVGVEGGRFGDIRSISPVGVRIQSDDLCGNSRIRSGYSFRWDVSTRSHRYASLFDVIGSLLGDATYSALRGDSCRGLHGVFPS